MQLQFLGSELLHLFKNLVNKFLDSLIRKKIAAVSLESVGFKEKPRIIKAVFT